MSPASATPTVTVHDVVAFLLRKNGSHLSMSAIHKMAYYAQGWHLAWAGTPLFAEEVRVRKTGPFVPALFPHQKDGFTTETWPAGDAHTLHEPEANAVEAVFGAYGHMTGIAMSELAMREAPCVLAVGRATADDTQPVIALADMKAFFKALDDAPKDQTAYANRFMSRYADEVLQVRP